MLRTIKILTLVVVVVVRDYDVQISAAVDSICFEVGFSLRQILKDNYFRRQKRW